MPAKDDSGSVSYNIEVADNMMFFPLAQGMRRSNLSEPKATMSIEPGTYYWRVQSVDPSGNKSKWALSPYAFQVGMINVWMVVGASLVLLVVFILLLRAFIQRVRAIIINIRLTSPLSLSLRRGILFYYSTKTCFFHDQLHT